MYETNEPFQDFKKHKQKYSTELRIYRRTGAFHNSPKQKTLSKVSVKQPAMRNREPRDLGNMKKTETKNQSMLATIGNKPIETLDAGYPESPK